MSTLKELLKKHCPDGVEYIKLEDFCSFIAGGDVPKNNFSKEKTTKYNIPIISNGIGANALYGYTNIIKIDEPCISISARGTIGHCIYHEEPFFPIVRLICIIPNDICIPKFLKYFFDNITIDVPKTGIPQLTIPMIKKTYVPVPPIEVQKEIVRILDEFSEKTNKLQELLHRETVLRKKQYEYYRGKLLTFGEDVEWKYLGEIGRVAMCKRVMKAETEKEGDIPFYKIGTFGKKADAFISRELFEEYRNKYSFPKKGDILISASGTIGRTVIYDGEPAYYQDSNIVWLEHDESIILNKYLFYCYQLKPWNITSGGTIQRLYNDNIRNAKIPVPPLEEQERIVKILDQFDTLCNDITKGLPAEIELRKKQYEYYRDKLLTFKEKKK